MEYNVPMSFFSFIKKLKTIWPRRAGKESYSLVFNIGSGSISGGIIKFTEKVGVDIVYYAKEMIPFQQKVSVPKHLYLMKSTLTTLAHKIQSEGLKGISTKKDESVSLDRVFYVFSSPWSVSQTKTIRIKEPKAFKVTADYLKRVIEEQGKKFQSNVLKSGKTIEKKIIQMKVNGYTVNDISNIFTNDLEISLFFTVVPEEILHIIEEAVSQVFDIKNIWCHSSTLSILSVVKNLFPQKEDYICLDISEEITDIAIVKDNIMTSSVSIPSGRNYFIRELSRVLKVSKEIADSMIKMHCAKNNNELASLKLSVAIDTISKSWLTSITDVLNSFKDKVYVPELIFLIANNDLCLFLKDKLHQQSFEVIFLDNNNIKSSLVKGDLVFKLELMFLDNLYKI